MNQDNATGAAVAVDVVDLGRMDYEQAFALQRAAQAQRIAARGTEHKRAPMQLFLVEHDPPVITVSRRKTARDHLVATPQLLERHGVVLAETDRGGDITYHGPGQLVAYPIFDLNRLGLRMHGYMRFLEQVVIDTLTAFGIDGQRDESATGVWTADPNDPSHERTAKICAMGVRVSRWVAMHGLALNVTTNLEHFNLIVPCGLAGRSVTSMQQMLGKRCPSINEVKTAMAARFRDAVEHQTG